MKQLVILGAGGHGRVVADIAELNGYDAIAFVDQRWPELRSTLQWPVTGTTLESAEAGADVFVAIGNNATRLAAVRTLLAAGRRVPVLVHPSAAVSRHATVAAGSVVMAQAAINPGADIGLAAIVNTGATVDHDCRIGDGAHISPGANLAGGVAVGTESWVGIGAAVREGMSIGARCMVGAGAVVIRAVPDGTQVMGVPAREGR